jgi:probable F420-dependent oxidoreductase
MEECAMQLAVNIFSLSHVRGIDDLLELARAIEAIGYDEIDLGDHVTIGRPTEGRLMPDPPAAPVLEPMVTLAAIAAAVRRVRLGTGVLILPQRQPALVAKQVATLDILSGGRIRLGVGAGWQAPEYESLGVPFAERGRRMDEFVEILRRYWRERSVTFHGRFYHAEAMAVDPPPVQLGGPPIWFGGGSAAALRRIGRLGDGWMAVGERPETVRDKVAVIGQAAEEAGRDRSTIGLQVLFGDVCNLDALANDVARFRAAGFTWGAVDMTQLTAAGANDLDALREALVRIKERIDREAA